MRPSHSVVNDPSRAESAKEVKSEEFNKIRKYQSMTRMENEEPLKITDVKKRSSRL